MHIAVCDDNVADRKQLERLLKRESDKRASASEILYTDSFGNAKALLANPMQYDVFYIDICNTDEITGKEVVDALIAQGVNAPIVMCSSKVNYREQRFPSNIIFLDKPIKVADLSTSIDHAIEIKSKALPLIELREEKNTVYVTEPDICYAVEEGRTLMVQLIDGRRIHMTTSAFNFFPQIESHPSFFAPTAKLIINGRHISKIGFRKIEMSDGAAFKIGGKCMEYARFAYEEFHGKATIAESAWS